MGGDKEKEKDDSDKNFTTCKIIHMILVVFVTIILWQKIYGALLDDVFFFLLIRKMV